MQLQSITYSEFEGMPREWRLNEMQFQPVNLIVGRNASGKSRTLNVINALSRAISGRQTTALSSGTYNITLEDDGIVWRYALKFENGKVTTERLMKGPEVLLDRGKEGFGKIYAEKEKKVIDFQSPAQTIAVFARQDAVQHAFLKSILDWANGVFHYAFGSQMGQNTLAITTPSAPSVDPHDTNQTAAIFRRGVKEHGSTFTSAIINDMSEIGYNLTEVGMKAPDDITIQGPVSPEAIFVLYAKERDLRGPTEQMQMSQGMFRAFSTIAQLNYGALSKTPSCVLIDDVGEGLDFERSTALIRVLVSKAEKTKTQILMTSNDRFVMNATPLQYWTLLDREGSVVNVHNIANSKDKFENFKFTGLNNFDFFATDFIHAEEKQS